MGEKIAGCRQALQRYREEGGKSGRLVTPYFYCLNDPKIYKYFTSTNSTYTLPIHVPGSVPSTEVISLSMPAGQPIDSYVIFIIWLAANLNQFL